MPERVLITGEPGTFWTNNTPKVRYQFVALLKNTCGYCLQYHLQIGPNWGIPLHDNCHCKQFPIRQGMKAPHAFADYRQILDDMPWDQKGTGDRRARITDS